MENKTDFSGQVVLVVGAASGIGTASAALLKSRGARVIVLDSNLQALKKVQAALSLRDDQIVELDISNQEKVEVAIANVFASEKRIDALVNSAGMTGPTNVKVEDISWADYEQTIRVNLFGAIWLTQQVIPIMKAQKYGRIVHVTSIAGKEGNPGMAPYNTSKAGMIGFVKGVGKEVAPDGITVNAIAPAVIRTPMNSTTSEETLKYMLARIPMGRVGEAEEVAELIGFIASRACSFTTGFTFDASGGRATY
ncbi:MAG: SDR family NAD(P)-dependent oxidoreductase [Candidatus Nanopelagicaceae bacterium]|nr:SDR family NAD(P)-dependent oxidoreductase [Candidatus Nanopelagicaceae bacterium]